MIQLRPLHAPVSVSVQECQEQQNQGWSTVRQLLVEAKRDISMVGRNAQFASEKVKTLQAGAFADLRWVGLVSCWVLGIGGGDFRGSHSPSPSAGGFRGMMDVTF